MESFCLTELGMYPKMDYINRTILEDINLISVYTFKFIVKLIVQVVQFWTYLIQLNGLVTILQPLRPLHPQGPRWPPSFRSGLPQVEVMEKSQQRNQLFPLENKWLSVMENYLWLQMWWRIIY